MTETMTHESFNLEAVPAIHRERVEALIPDPEVAERYVHRKVRGVLDFDLFDVALEEAENILLVGPTGSSKTTAARAYAAARRLPFAIVECNGAMDPGFVLGRTMLDEETERPHWIDGDFTLVCRYGGVGLFDEADMAHARINAAFHQILSVARRISIPEAGETIIAGRGVAGMNHPTLFIAALNGRRYEGTTKLNAAFRNRFAMPYKWGYEREVEEQLIDSARLLEAAERMRDQAEVRTPVSTNSLMEFERHVLRLGVGLAMEFFVNRFEEEEQGFIERALEAHASAIEAEVVAANVEATYEAEVVTQ